MDATSYEEILRLLADPDLMPAQGLGDACAINLDGCDAEDICKKVLIEGDMKKRAMEVIKELKKKRARVKEAEDRKKAVELEAAEAKRRAEVAAGPGDAGAGDAGGPGGAAGEAHHMTVTHGRKAMAEDDDDILSD